MLIDPTLENKVLVVLTLLWVTLFMYSASRDAGIGFRLDGALQGLVTCIIVTALLWVVSICMRFLFLT